MLLEKRRDATEKVYAQNLTRMRAGQGQPSELFGWSERWLDAELELAGTKDERAKVLKDDLERTREIERRAPGFAKVGQGRGPDASAATYYRVEAEIRLAKEGVEVPPEKK